MLLGTLDGGLGYLLPVPEKAYRRLSMLQIKMVHGIPHDAGLNPKAYRYVPSLSLCVFSSTRYVPSLSLCVSITSTSSYTFECVCPSPGVRKGYGKGL